MKIFAALLFCLMTACKPRPPAESVYAITGSQAERIKAISTIISKHTALPSPLLDANFLEEQIGDGHLGPSDFHAFYVLTVAPVDIPAWDKLLTPLQPLDSPPNYVGPKQSSTWWLNFDTFPRLKFYSPQKLTGRIHGWVGFVPEDGKIYIHTYTM